MWDRDEHKTIRPHWSTFYQPFDGFLFVIDSPDQQRFQEARDKLLSIIKCNEVVTLPFVIVANKSDILTAAKSSELMEELDLHAICRQQWSIQSTSAMTGDGIIDVMQQLAKMIKDKRRSSCA